ncbi:MAG: cell division protein ZapE [Thiohalophilus sp.]|uniref:cell division protein ZapE n=1 Tax=Thiohalophilus sp. TaxID=3028392 RepID=UPI00287014E6|nr:cell division protein ZapE [Thiohalophilus sp.]MDR9436137.1 cell division protein ZapE [Thiohalophilus sp.]
MSTPQERYQSDLEHNGFVHDPQQAAAVEQTQRLYEELLAAEHRRPGLLERLLDRRPEPVRGLYVRGGTGRGKTYLVDSFYDCLPFRDKHRVHYHRFMIDIHARLRDLPRSPDPLVVIANEIADQLKVLCLDEFHVHDIADAMLLGGLLKALFDKGVTLVATSNIPIDELYKNGLQRERFMFAIELLKWHTCEVDLEQGTDYRFRLLEASQNFHVADPEEGEKLITAAIEQMAPDTLKHDRQLTVNKRPIAYRALADDVIWFDFNALCNTPRSANDYIQIAQQFHTVYISNIFRMTEAHDNVAKRFVHLIDALYDHNVKLVAAAEVPPAELYAGKRLAFGFERAVSRISEMGSAAYLALPHRLRTNPLT